ncbi:SLC13/DASS family transporter [Catenovulum sp. SM1970]|uniref:SLC13 family permease n=1 Tax=Marinifaba aquimaris TaxID=2741323 RepID=UPI0015749024|nr:SLC13 family permease [Marinifaba aquimaris]NTS77970.1 SLC13/DASS family transporter [Marinifaba aquimaris]
MQNTQYFILAICLAFISYFSAQFFGLEQVIALTLAITVLTGTCWVTEALPIPVTSLFPFALFPLFGVIDHKTAASALGSHVILLLMGAFMLSKAVEKSGVHHRIALCMVSKLGINSPKRVVFGFMLAAATLSMWISNTATTLMLLPIVIAVGKTSGDQRFTAVLLLGVAYAASVGGMGTPIGTPPNIIFMAVFEQEFGFAPSFTDWMSLAVPIVLCAIPLMALWLTRGIKLSNALTLPEVGAWTKAEKRVLLVFAVTACAWIFRQAPFGGWSDWLGIKTVGDSTIALMSVAAMFIVSSGVKENGKILRLLDWKTASHIPWGMLLLFAGGICIAKAFQASGLSQLLGDQLTTLATWPTYLMIIAVCLTVTFLTEITSNTATTTLLMPILAVAGVAAAIDPKLLMIPAALSASCAFMLPVATAPNAIVYGADAFKISTMAREGVVLNILLAIVISGFVYFSI